MKTTKMRISRGYLCRTSNSKDTQRKVGWWESFIMKRGEGFKYVLGRVCWLEKAGVRLREVKHPLSLVGEFIWLSLVDPKLEDGDEAKIRKFCNY